MTEIQKKKMLLGFIMDGTSGGVDNYILHFLDGGDFPQRKLRHVFPAPSDNV